MKKIIRFIKDNKHLRRVLILFLSVGGLFFLIAIIPPKKVIDYNPFITPKDYGVLIAAHRGGKNLNPENTFKAFNYAIENYDIDILELDLCMTKDNYLVSIHNETINDTSDVEEVRGSKEPYYVIDHTLAELSNFNFGAKFVDKNGVMPYKDLVRVNQENRSEVIRNEQLNIVTIDEIFAAYYDTDLKFIVEIKNSGDVGKKAADLLADLLQVYDSVNLINRVVIGTFHDEIAEYLQKKYPNIIRGGSVGEVTQFIISQMLGVNLFNNPSFECLQIPISESAAGINLRLDKPTYIKRAHRRNISVQYWTINDRDTMERLIKLGADVIMTDDPDLLYGVLKNMGYR